MRGNTILDVVTLVVVSVLIALMVFIAAGQRPFAAPADYSARDACMMVCPRATIAGICPVKRVPWFPPHKCVVY